MADERVVSDEWRFRARVVSDYDGDTFGVVLKLGMRQTCGDESDPTPVRLDGIDTPEIKSKDPDLHAKALAAHTHLRDAFDLSNPGRLDVLVYPRKASKIVFDKYDRLLAVVYYQRVTEKKVSGKTVKTVKWINLNQELLDLGLARPYDGRGPKPW